MAFLTASKGSRSRTTFERPLNANMKCNSGRAHLGLRTDFYGEYAGTLE